MPHELQRHREVAVVLVAFRVLSLATEAGWSLDVAKGLCMDILQVSSMGCMFARCCNKVQHFEYLGLYTP